MTFPSSVTVNLLLYLQLHFACLHFEAWGNSKQNGCKLEKGVGKTEKNLTKYLVAIYFPKVCRFDKHYKSCNDNGKPTNVSEFRRNIFYLLRSNGLGFQGVCVQTVPSRTIRNFKCIDKLAFSQVKLIFIGYLERYDARKCSREQGILSKR